MAGRGWITSVLELFTFIIHIISYHYLYYHIVHIIITCTFNTSMDYIYNNNCGSKMSHQMCFHEDKITLCKVFHWIDSFYHLFSYTFERNLQNEFVIYTKYQVQCDIWNGSNVSIVILPLGMFSFLRMDFFEFVISDWVDVRLLLHQKIPAPHRFLFEWFLYGQTEFVVDFKL